MEHSVEEPYFEWCEEEEMYVLHENTLEIVDKGKEQETENAAGSSSNSPQSRAFQRPTTNYSELDAPSGGGAPPAPEFRQRLGNVMSDRSNFTLRRAPDGSILPKPTMPARTIGNPLAGAPRPLMPRRATLSHSGLIPAGARNPYTLKRTGAGKPAVPQRHPSPLSHDRLGEATEVRLSTATPFSLLRARSCTSPRRSKSQEEITPEPIPADYFFPRYRSLSTVVTPERRLSVHPQECYPVVPLPEESPRHAQYNNWSPVEPAYDRSSYSIKPAKETEEWRRDRWVLRVLRQFSSCKIADVEEAFKCPLDLLSAKNRIVAGRSRSSLRPIWQMRREVYRLRVLYY